jgi:hypothetical protein
MTSSFTSNASAAVSSAARTTLAELIARVRLMVNDPSGDSQVFSDLDYQAWLDLHRAEVRLVELQPDPLIGSGGQLSFQDFYAPRGVGAFEADVVFQGPSWDAITPDSSELLVGHFHWDASHVFPIFVTGKAFDLNAAAADALEAWASKVALEYSFSSDGQRFDRQQQRTMLLDQAREYRKKQKPRSASMGRRDIAR